MRRTTFSIVLLWVVAACALHRIAHADGRRPNVLFIAVDDLRPEIACYGNGHMQTPHLDRLAQRGVLLERAYCMVPTCGASRAALMTGLRPARQRFVNYLTYAERDAPEALPLHSHFQANGYHTVSLGKVFHHRDDHEDGWSERPWRSSRESYQDQAALREAIAQHKALWPNKRRHRGPAFEAYDAPDEQYPDGDCALQAIERLRRFAEDRSQPFFLAVGLMKPHLPFNAPQKYWDLYDKANIDLPDNYHPPKGAPSVAVHNSGELRSYAGIPPSGPVDRGTARHLIHGYYACVSFADAQVGKLLDALDRLGLAEDTVVVLWGDHGWQLGEHRMWNKHSCFETSMHAPLMVAAPGDAAIKPGARVGSLVEFIDVYPTLCDLCGLQQPSHLQGESLISLLRDPNLPGKTFAIGRYQSGDTIRSDSMRYSRYTTRQGEQIGQMLYDHRSDPGENLNVAPEESDAVQRLSEALAQRMGR